MTIKGFKILLVTAMAFILLALLFTQLWNFAVPVIFKLPEIRFSQSLALIVMTRILFSAWGSSYFRRNLSNAGLSEKPPGLSNDHTKASPESVHHFKSTWAGLCSRLPVEALEEKVFNPQEVEKQDN